MATKVFMEALSPTMEEGRLVKWLKNEGDAVKSGEALAEVETDKAIMELVARGDGILRKRLINEGDTAPVGTLAGVIATADENIDALVAGAAPAGAPAAAAPAAPQPAAASSVPTRPEESQGEASTPPQRRAATAPPAPPVRSPWAILGGRRAVSLHPIVVWWYVSGRRGAPADEAVFPMLLPLTAMVDRVETDLGGLAGEVTR